MPLNTLHHCSIRTLKLQKTRDFYVDVLGMEDGKRPSFDLSMFQAFGPDDLQGLHVRNRKMSPVIGLHHITRLSGLRYLALLNVEIGDEDLEHFRALRNLEVLFLDRTRFSRTRVTEAGLNRLRAALPDCTINGVKHAPKRRQVNRRPIA